MIVIKNVNMVYIFSDNSERSPIVAKNRSHKMREILSVALKLACEGGLDNLTLHRLADRMERSVGAVYRYFPSKEAVVAEVQRLIATHIGLLSQDAQEKLEDFAEENHMSDEDRALAALLVSGLSYEAYAMKAPLEFGLVSHYLSSTRYDLPERDAARVFSVTGSSLDGLAGLFTQAEDLHLLREGCARDRAVAFWGALQGTMDVTRVVTRGGWQTSPSLITQILISLLTGWGADRTRLETLSNIIAGAQITNIKRDASDLLLAD